MFIYTCINLCKASIVVQFIQDTASHTASYNKRSQFGGGVLLGAG